MGIFQGSKERQLKKLQLQLANVNRQLDEMEKRSALRIAEANSFENRLPDDPETRFAACVASGMSKMLVKS